jgi:hypothetical protein
MSSVRAQAEIFFDADNTYDGLFADGGAPDKLLDAAQDQTGKTPFKLADDAGWVAGVQLRSDATKVFCVDSTGFAGKIDYEAAWDIDSELATTDTCLVH